MKMAIMCKLKSEISPAPHILSVDLPFSCLKVEVIDLQNKVFLSLSLYSFVSLMVAEPQRLIRSGTKYRSTITI